MDARLKFTSEEDVHRLTVLHCSPHAHEIAQSLYGQARAFFAIGQENLAGINGMQGLRLDNRLAVIDKIVESVSKEYGVREVFLAQNILRAQTLRLLSSLYVYYTLNHIILQEQNEGLIVSSCSRKIRSLGRGSRGIYG